MKIIPKHTDLIGNLLTIYDCLVTYNFNELILAKVIAFTSTMAKLYKLGSKKLSSNVLQHPADLVIIDYQAVLFIY
jgi:hypothetical protein